MPNREWPFWKTLTYSLIPLLLCLIAAESVSFVFYCITGRTDKPNLRFHPLFRPTKVSGFTDTPDVFQFDPHLGFRFKPSVRTHNLDINGQGFVGNGNTFPDLKVKQPNTTRIIVLGGSTVAGAGVSSNENTIPAILERELNADAENSFEVINAGVMGYDSYHEFLYFASSLIYFKPDLVIFYDGWNDLAEGVKMGGYADEFQEQCCPQSTHEYSLYLLKVFPYLQRNGFETFDFSHLLNKFYATLLLQSAIRRVTHSNGELAVEDFTDARQVRNLEAKRVLGVDKVVSNYVDNIANAFAIAAARKIKFIHVFQPSIYQKKQLTPDEAYWLESPSLNRSDIDRFYTRAPIALAELKKKTASSNVVFCDLSHGVWDDVPQKVYTDECHTNDLGSSIIAKQLASLVRVLYSDRPVQLWSSN